MARRRYISTDISIDKVVNQLAVKYGDFAALFYTWMIPHVEDDCEITGDPGELLTIVCPWRRDKSESDIENVIQGMLALDLMHSFERDGKRVLMFPPNKFYKFQSYISKGNRCDLSAAERATPKNAAVYGEIAVRDADHAVRDGECAVRSAEYAASPPLPPSLSPSPSLSLSIDEEEESAGQVFKFFNNNIGLIRDNQNQIICSFIEDGLKPSMIVKVMEDGIGKSTPWDWIKAVLQDCVENKVFTQEQYEAHKAERKRRKERNQSRNGYNKKPVNMGNYDQRQYTPEFLDSLYENTE